MFTQTVLQGERSWVLTWAVGAHPLPGNGGTGRGAVSSTKWGALCRCNSGSITSSPFWGTKTDFTGYKRRVQMEVWRTCLKINVLTPFSPETFSWCEHVQKCSYSVGSTKRVWAFNMCNSPLQHREENFSLVLQIPFQLLGHSLWDDFSKLPNMVPSSPLTSCLLTGS